jgi:RNA polymerase sigma-70 factor (ECF subfamily)
MVNDESAPTRASLIERLRNPADQASWKEFYDLYHDLIFSVARRAGLNETEAAEVVQDTLVSVAKKMPEFRYEPGKDSFKGWLLTVTRWRICDQLSTRPARPTQSPRSGSAQDGLPETRTSTIDRVPDPAGPELSAIWEQEWQTHLLQKALARIKRQVHPQHYQAYHLSVIAGRPAGEVARTIGLKVTQVYMAKYRIGNLLKQEVKRLKETLL